jgi:putative SOS response-associated peptidase YedK
MPVLLAPGQFDAWLDPAWRDVEALRRWLVPAPAATLAASPVSTRVSNARNEGEDLIEPL